MDLTQTPVLFAESPFNPDQSREKLCELLFEQDSIPALFMARDAMLAALASGKTSGLVLDLGGGFCAAAPIVDGYVLNSSLLKTKFAGEMMDEVFLKMFSEKLVVHPFFEIKRSIDTEGKRHFARQQFPATSRSYHLYMQKQVMRDLKESVCRVSDSPFDFDSGSNIPTLPYELPDGTMLAVGPPRFTVPELLFNPNPKLMPQFVDFDNYSFGGIPSMVCDAIKSCDIDARKDMYSNIIVIGGLSAIAGMTDRIAVDVELALKGSQKVRVTNPSTGAERKYAVWIGGSILGSLGSFQQMWISQAEYKEQGSRVLFSRCP